MPSNNDMFNAHWQISNLKMVNWGSFCGGPHQIDFAKGDGGTLTMFSGNSGTGKSSVLDALTVMLFSSSRTLNKASEKSGDRSTDPRNIYSYTRGYIKHVESDTGTPKPSYYRGEDANGNKVSTWSALSVTLESSLQGRYTLAGFFYIVAGNATDAKKVWTVIPGEPNIADAEQVAASCFTKSSIRQVFPDALVISENKQDMRRVYHELVGINKSSEDLMYRIMTGASESNITSIFRDIVLEKPETVEGAQKLCDMYDLHRKSIAEWQDSAKRQAALKTIASQNDEANNLHASLTVYETWWDRTPSSSDKEAYNRWFAERFLTDVNTACDNMQKQLDSIKETQGKLSNTIAQKKKELATCRSAYEQAGGNSISVLKASVEELTAKLHVAIRQRDQIARYFKKIEEDMPDSESTWNRRLGILESDSVTFDEKLQEFDQQKLSASMERSVLSAKLDDAEEALKTAQKLGTKIPPAMDSARKLLAAASGLAPKDIQYAAELFDMKPDAERWRLAANVAYADVADTLLVNDADEISFWNAIRDTSAEKIARRCRFRFVNPSTAILDPSAKDGFLSSQISFKESSFAGAVKQLLESSDVDCLLCGNGVFSTTATDRQVTEDGIVREIDGGIAGYAIAPDLIGFVDEQHILKLKNDVAALKQKRAEATYRISSCEEEVSIIRASRDLYNQMSTHDWASIDTATVRFQLDQTQARIDEALADESLKKLADDIQSIDNELGDLNASLRSANSSASTIESTLDTYSSIRETVEVKAHERTECIDVSETLASVFGNAYAASNVAEILTSCTGAGADVMFAQLYEGKSNAVAAMVHREALGIKDKLDRQKQLIETQMQNFKIRFGASELGDGYDSINDYLALAEHDDFGEAAERHKSIALQQLRAPLTTFNEMFTRYEDDVRSAFAKVNSILASYAFDRKNESVLQLRPLFTHNESYREFTKILKDLIIECGTRAESAYSHMDPEEKDSILDQYGALVEMLRERNNVPTDLADLRSRLTVKVEVDDGTKKEIISTSSSMNGGKREKVKAFVLSAALFYTLKTPADSNPAFAPVLFDEAFVQSDLVVTQTAIKAMMGFGFQLFISCPDGKQGAILPIAERAWITSRANDEAPSMLNALIQVPETTDKDVNIA